MPHPLRKEDTKGAVLLRIHPCAGELLLPLGGTEEPPVWWGQTITSRQGPSIASGRRPAATAGHKPSSTSGKGKSLLTQVEDTVPPQGTDPVSPQGTDHPCPRAGPGAALVHGFSFS